MYIVAIGWMYVVTLMAATENSIAAGVATFLFYGVLPCSVLVYIMGTKNRRLRREFQELQAQRSEAAGKEVAEASSNATLEATNGATNGATSEPELPSALLGDPAKPLSDEKTSSNP